MRFTKYITKFYSKPVSFLDRSNFYLSFLHFSLTAPVTKSTLVSFFIISARCYQFEPIRALPTFHLINFFQNYRSVFYHINSFIPTLSSLIDENFNFTRPSNSDYALFLDYICWLYSFYCSLNYTNTYSNRVYLTSKVHGSFCSLISQLSLNAPLSQLVHPYRFIVSEVSVLIQSRDCRFTDSVPNESFCLLGLFISEYDWVNGWFLDFLGHNFKNFKDKGFFWKWTTQFSSESYNWYEKIQTANPRFTPQCISADKNLRFSFQSSYDKVNKVLVDKSSNIDNKLSKLSVKYGLYFEFFHFADDYPYSFDPVDSNLSFWTKTQEGGFIGLGSDYAPFGMERKVNPERSVLFPSDMSFPHRYYGGPSYNTYARPAYSYDTFKNLRFIPSDYSFRFVVPPAEDFASLVFRSNFFFDSFYSKQAVVQRIVSILWYCYTKVAPYFVSFNNMLVYSQLESSQSWTPEFLPNIQEIFHEYHKNMPAEFSFGQFVIDEHYVYRFLTRITGDFYQILFALDSVSLQQCLSSMEDYRHQFSCSFIEFCSIDSNATAFSKPRFTRYFDLGMYHTIFKPFSRPIQRSHERRIDSFFPELDFDNKFNFFYSFELSLYLIITQVVENSLPYPSIKPFKLPFNLSRESSLNSFLEKNYGNRVSRTQFNLSSKYKSVRFVKGQSYIRQPKSFRTLFQCNGIESRFILTFILFIFFNNFLIK